MMFLSKYWYFSVQKALIYYTVKKSHHNSFILLVFSHMANFRYVAKFRFLTLYHPMPINFIITTDLGAINGFLSNCCISALTVPDAALLLLRPGCLSAGMGDVVCGKVATGRGELGPSNTSEKQGSILQYFDLVIVNLNSTPTYPQTDHLPKSRTTRID